ncbi:MAG: class IV adenylate cyclase [Ignavibacteriae bacterium]|nr:class IV adenylate cyclase [Ignavibacteriota bacterium]
MAVNLEIKVKLETFDEILKILSEKNVFQNQTILQKDIYYKIPAGLLKLRKHNDGYELIKYQRNEKDGERWSNYFVLNISGETVENYFDDIFETETVVEKIRELYIYKSTRIHLDEVKNLGKFIELETVVKNISQVEAKTEFDEIVKFLELDFENQIKKSYRDLILEK